ncbi:MAG: hypothetical protein GX490_07205 [Bacilli bacterium]|nr:hypothetical protein [Bacilli bacterium]
MMGKKRILSKVGASLLEIIAAVAISSTALLLIYNVLSYNVRQNGINHDKVRNTNVAYGALNYLINYDYSKLEDYLEANSSNMYIKVTGANCGTIYFPDNKTCLGVFNPTLNNKSYTNDDIIVFIFPHRHKIAITKLREYIIIPDNFKDKTVPLVLEEFINDELSTAIYDTPNLSDIKVFSIIVYVKSGINHKYDVCLHGVITRD